MTNNFPCTQTPPPDPESPPAAAAVESVSELNEQVEESTSGESFKLRAVLLPSAIKPAAAPPIPPTLESLFKPPQNAPKETTEEEIGALRKASIHGHLQNVSTSRLRRLSDVEECEVEPLASNYPFRYGQRRSSNTNKTSTVSSELNVIIILTGACTNV